MTWSQTVFQVNSATNYDTDRFVVVLSLRHADGAASTGALAQLPSNGL
jgi:hypothetical protein